MVIYRLSDDSHLIIISHQRTVLSFIFFFFFRLHLSAIIECPLPNVPTPHGSGKMIKNRNMLIFINKNLIKFSTCLEWNFSLEFSSPARRINFQFANVSDFHYSGFYFHRVYLEFLLFQHRKLQFSCKMIFFLLVGCTQKPETLESGEMIHHTSENPFSVLHTEEIFEAYKWRTLKG